MNKNRGVTDTPGAHLGQLGKDLYDQIVDMYRHDFEIFGYPLKEYEESVL